MAKVIVTGGAGFVASHVTDALLEVGHEVIGVDSLSTSDGSNFNPKANNVVADIINLSPGYFVGIEYVFHLAALARIQPSIVDPIPPHNSNVNGTLHLLEMCRKFKCKLIFSSSSSIYSGDQLPTKEDAPKDPHSPYGLQKLLCEQYIRLYKELYGLEYATLRYFNVFGERQILSGAYAAVVGIFLDQKSKGLPLTITGDGTQRRDFTYVKDVAKANVMAMDWQGTFNVGSGENYSINEIADKVGGKKKYLEGRPGEAFATHADNSKAKDKGWKPTKNILEWIEENG